MKFSVIGCGSIGRRHISNLLKLGHEVIAYNRGLERRKIVKNNYNIQIYKNIDQMYDENNFDASIICSPNNLHIKNSMTAVKNNSHIFIEKPLSLPNQNITSIKKLIKKNKIISHIGSNMRFHYGPKKIKSILDKKILGRIINVDLWAGMYLPDWHPYEDYTKMYSAHKKLGGGVLMDMVHELDLCLWYFGLPLKVFSFINNSKSLRVNTEDIANILMRYKNNIYVNIHLNYLNKPFRRGIRILGSKGLVEWNIEKNNVSLHIRDENYKKIYKYPKGYKHNDMYIDQMKFFCKCIKNNKKSSNDIFFAEKVMKLVKILYESSAKEKSIKYK